MAFNPVPFLKDWCSLHLRTMPPLAADGWEPVSCFSAGNHCSVWFLCWFSFFSWVFFVVVMLPSEIPKLLTDLTYEGFLLCRNFSSFTTPSLGGVSVPKSFVSLFVFIFCPTSFWRDWFSFLGIWGSAVSIQKVFCGSCSTLRSFFDVFIGEKVVSLSYSSSILEAPSKSSFYCTIKNIQI